MTPVKKKGHETHNFMHEWFFVFDPASISPECNDYLPYIELFSNPWQNHNFLSN